MDGSFLVLPIKMQKPQGICSNFKAVAALLSNSPIPLL
jgi:hypothetical protein